MISGFFILLILVLVIASIWWYTTIPSNLPPGPRGLPFFGSMFDVWSGAKMHEKLQQWQKVYGSIYSIYIGNKLLVIIAGYDAMHEALVKNGNACAGRPDYVIQKAIHGSTVTYGLAISEGDLWKIQRKFALTTLRQLGLGKSKLEEHIKDECVQLASAIHQYEGEPFSPLTLLNNAVSNVICALVFGRRFDYDDEEFAALLENVRIHLGGTDVSLLSPALLLAPIAKLTSMLPQVKIFKKAGIEIREFTKKEIATITAKFDPERDEPENYIEAFYKVKNGNEADWTFTDEQLHSTVIDLLTAGSETTFTTLRWAVLYLAHYPDWQERLYAEMKTELGNKEILDYADKARLPLMQAAMLEILRMANVGPLGLLHRATEDFVLSGYSIPADTLIVPLITTVLRDPLVFPHPETFDPTRFSICKDAASHVIPFSVGQRTCLGDSLARMELFFFLSTLILKYKISFDKGQKYPSITYEHIGLVRSPESYKISAIPTID